MKVLQTPVAPLLRIHEEKENSMKKTAVLGAIALLSVSSAAFAQSGATFCADAYAGGTCTSPKLQPGYYTLSQLASYGFQNDWASSFYTNFGSSPDGVTGQLFADDNFGGQHWELQQSDGANLANVGADNTVSSVKIRSGVTFFQNANYDGNATSAVGLASGCYTLAALQSYGFINDWASSVIIPHGKSVDLYSDDNFRGTKWTLTQMDSNSANFSNFGGNDAVSSVCVR